MTKKRNKAKASPKKYRSLDVKQMMKNSMECHAVWHKFSGWLMKTFGKDLYSEAKPSGIKNSRGKEYMVRTFDGLELSRRLGGYEVMQKIERYVKRACPEIRILRCDDEMYTGSLILLVPHPSHGITVMFIPQLSLIQNKFFLYESHYDLLIKNLIEMKSVYKPMAKSVYKTISKKATK